MAIQRPEWTMAATEAAVGTEIARTPWMSITPDAVTRFGTAAGRAIMPGSPVPADMLLSLLGGLIVHVPRIEATAFAMNYGIDRFRVVRPVQTGQPIRVRFVLSGLEMRGVGRTLTTLSFLFETETEVAATGDWLILAVA